MGIPPIDPGFGVEVVEIAVFIIHKWSYPNRAIWFLPLEMVCISTTLSMQVPVFVLHRPKNFKELKRVSSTHSIWQEIDCQPTPLEVFEAYQICGGRHAIERILEAEVCSIKGKDPPE